VGRARPFVDRAAAIAEGARVLRPDGQLIIGMGSDGSWYRRLAGLFAPGDSDAHLRPLDVAAIADMLGETLELASVETLAYLRPPLRVECLARRLSSGAQERLIQRSDAVLRRLPGPQAGGMMFLVARLTPD